MGKGLDGCRNTFKKRAKKCLPAFCKENKPIRRIIRKILIEKVLVRG